jgi:DNA-binding LacI/PurR family transcriptional regulator
MARRTLRDVAIHAGVSKATASRVLNQRRQVDAGTRQRVLEAMAELEYTPSNAARRLSMGRTLTLHVAIWRLTTPQAAERLRGVEAVLSDTDFDLVIRNAETAEKRNQALHRLPLAQRTDGLLVISLQPNAEETSDLLAAPVPVVVVDAFAPDVQGLPHVVGDDIAGAETAMSHLLGLGHRRIGFIGDQIDDPLAPSTRHRYLGYERALTAAGLAISPELLGFGKHGRYEARDLAASMLTMHDRPTAIFAASDTQALGVISAAHEVGLRIPEGLSVVGYDDIEIASYVGLTTVRQHLYESGRLGAEMLLSEVQSRSIEPPSIVLKPELVVRGTTAPPKEG